MIDYKIIYDDYYNSELSIKDISKKYNHNDKSIAYNFKKLGYPLKNKWQKNKFKIKKILEKLL